MIIKSIKAKGFKGLRNLVGSGELSVDLSGLRGMVGISGTNGTGKTTFLELLHPYRLMVSRATESLKNQVFLTDSHKDLEFQFGEDAFRSLVKINSRTGKNEAFLWRNGENLVPNGNCDIYDSLVNKFCGPPELFFSSAFCAQKGERARRITELTKGEKKGLFIGYLGHDRLEVFKNLSGKLSGILANKTQELFREIDRLSALIGTASVQDLEQAILGDMETAGNFERRIQAFEEQIGIHQHTINHLNVRDAEERAKELQQQSLRAEIARLAGRVDMDRHKIKDMGIEQAQIRLNSEDTEGIGNKIARARQLIEELESDQVVVTEARRKLVVNRDEREADLRKLEDEKLGRDSKKEEMRKEIARLTDSVRNSGKKIENLESEKKLVRSGMGDADGWKKQYDQLDLKVKDLQSQETVAKARREEKKNLLVQIGEELKSFSLRYVEAMKLDSQIKSLEDLAGELKQRPAECKIDACPFISYNLERANRIPGLKAEYEQKYGSVQDEEKYITKKKEDVNASLDVVEKGLTKISADLYKLSEERDVLRDMLNRSSVLEESLRGLDVMISQLTVNIELDKKIIAHQTEEREAIQIDGQLGQRIHFLKGEVLNIKDQLVYEENRLTAILTEIRKQNKDLSEFQERKQRAELAVEKIRGLEESIALLQKSVEDGEKLVEARTKEAEAIIIDRTFAQSILNVEKEKRAMEFDLAGIRQQAQDLNVKIAQGRERMAVVKDNARRKTEIETRISMLSAHQRDWSAIQSFCGPDKIQALEIDAAAPIVTQTANDLLRSCFGDQFSIRFQTVKDGKEVFDILVYDQNVGEEKNLKDISGGEEVWILKALRLALVLLTKEKSGREYLTLYGDEEDGKLALENRLAYLDMYKRMLKLGNFQACFLVSHTPELIEACDHKMYFRRGGIDIR